MIPEEFTKVCRWRVIPYTGIPTIKYCSFIYAEWAYFEGIYLPHKINLFGITESFENAHDRMSRYYQIPHDERQKAVEVFYKTNTP